MFEIDDSEIDRCIESMFYDEEERGEDLIPLNGCLIGDHVICKIKEGIVLPRYERCIEKMTVTISGKRSLDENCWEYIAYVPEYEAIKIKSAFQITKDMIRRYGMHSKYIGESGFFLRKDQIIKIVYKADGCWCRECEEFCDKAEPNQEGGVFICYRCRQNPYK